MVSVWTESLLQFIHQTSYNVTLLESGDTWKVSRSDKPTCIALEVSPTVWRHFPGGAIIWKCWFLGKLKDKILAAEKRINIHFRHWHQDLNSVHNGGRQTLSPVCCHCFWLFSTMYVTLTVIWSGEGRFLSPLGGGGGSRPSLIFSCFSFSISLRRWVRIFFLSFFVNMIGTEGASLGSASCREKTHEKTKEI